MLTCHGTQPLSTSRLTLRRFTPEDAPAMFANWASDPRTAKYLTWDAHASREVTRSLLESWAREYDTDASCYQWGIVLEGELIGSISLLDVSQKHARCELGYCIGPRWWNRGVMTEAAAAVLDFAFDREGFEKVGAIHDVENPASGRVMQKLGMALEGTLRAHHLRKDGSRADLRIYGILAEEWQAHRKEMVSAYGL